MEWYGDAFLAEMEARARKNVEAGCVHYVAAAKKNIGTQGPPRSKPGESPHKDTTRLHRSVTYQMFPNYASDPYGLAGTDVFYGGLLETGTSKTSARPWVIRTLNAETRTIVTILSDFSGVL